MFQVGRRTTHNATAPPSALDALLATEKEIAAQMADAAREASALTAAANSDAETIEHEAAAVLSTELAALDKRDAGARAELVHRLESDASHLVERYRALTNEEIGRLAMFVVTDITGFPAESAP